MRMLIEDDGTFEIIEIKIVRVQGRERQASKSTEMANKNNITPETVMNVVRSISLTIFGVAQLASLLFGSGFHT